MRVLNRLRNLFPLRHPLIRRDPIVYRAIGVVRNQVREPRTTGWEDVRSDIFLREELSKALAGLDGFSHVIVVFHLDRISDDQSRALLLPLERENGGEIGVFATRIPLRPNAIGVGVARIVLRRQNVLRVKGLDALDGSPVLDLKPYLPRYDAAPDATLPEWAVKAMEQ